VTTSVFSRFAPRLQEAIVSRLGWTSLRPVQEQAGAALLDGKNAVVLAPTAGGKTEAAMFPTLSMLVTDQPEGVGAIYIAPIKALLNNQADRLGTYTEMVGLRRFLWHGDIDTSRAQFIKEPAELLMTTPESMEVMLASAKVPVPKLFSELRIVVIDEVHALAGTDRGAHLMSVLERIGDNSKHDVQRVGLSATVGNPDAILHWLRGTSKREGIVVDPPKVPQVRQIAVHLDPEDDGALAKRAADAALGRKSLFFCGSRRLTESVADRLRGRGTDVFVHHSSVSLAERKLAEERFQGTGSAMIACTSTLELGIDVGDLDNVFQADAPDTVSSFLQRMGRTGRRAGSVANTTFFCSDPEAVLQAVALVELAKEGWVEPIPPQTRCWPVLVHQLLAFTLALGGIQRDVAWQKLSRLPDLSDITRFEFDQAVDFMVLHDFLFEAGGMLSMGDAAERKYGRKNFLELYAVFSSPQFYTVIGPNGSEVGSLEQAFVDNLEENLSSFLLGGRAWLVASIDHKAREISATPAPRGKMPSWGGFVPQMLGFEVCQRIKRLLCDTTEYPYLSEQAAATLREYREDFAALLQRGNALQISSDGVRWWTYAGGRINQTLKHALEELTGWKIVTDNFHLRFTGDGLSQTAVVAALENLAAPSFWEDDGLWRKIVARIPPYRFSKFQVALPPRFELELVGRYLLDLDGARRFILGGASGTAPSDRVADLLSRVISTFPVAVPGPQPPAINAARPERSIRYIDNDAALAALCDQIASRAFVTLDVETTLVDRNLCLIQVGTDDINAVIDARAPLDFEPLARIFESPQIVKVVHNATFERSVFSRINIRLANVFDTLAASRRIRGKQSGGHSLAAVCKRELDKVIDKSQQVSDWTRRPLSPEQLAYAALDVEVLVHLYMLFTSLQPELALVT
jgi:ATP-dependent Lhr-like helicase